MGTTPPPQDTWGAAEGHDPQELSMSDILNYIKGTQTELVTKIYTVVVDDTLLREDLRRVAHRVTEAEEATGVFNCEVDPLKDTGT
ncbi:hypothetical protein NDU88_002636 [Pleurodeles waltl]|uniref:Uncharacterized protein n=1 Tax=Pleurodeles waltl TaxID=8319 RepID=A0AAV7M6K4_PLEWA|nr:hypothetical protein NDU88_002636 [Pleurodeles waltl]